MNEADMIDVAGLERALSWHLRHNHYPPVPADMIPVCAAAIDAALAEDYNAEIDLPEGTSYKGRTTAPVWAIVDAHHLGAFIEAADVPVCSSCGDEYFDDGHAFDGECPACADLTALLDDEVVA
jgi:hypothetical protein